MSISKIHTSRVTTDIIFAEINALGALFLETIKKRFQKRSVLCTPPPRKITHQKPLVLCTPPFENHCFWWALISGWAFISANTVYNNEQQNHLSYFGPTNGTHSLAPGNVLSANSACRVISSVCCCANCWDKAWIICEWKKFVHGVMIWLWKW